MVGETLGFVCAKKLTYCGFSKTSDTLWNKVKSVCVLGKNGENRFSNCWWEGRANEVESI